MDTTKGRLYNSIRPEKFKTPEQIQWEIYRQQMEKKIFELEPIKKQSFLIEFEEWFRGVVRERSARNFTRTK